MSTEVMSSRERLLAALSGQEVDRIPWSPCRDDYFLGSGDATPKTATWENLLAVTEVVEEQGRYPLRV